MIPKKPELSDEQKQQMRGMVKTAVRDMIKNREDLQNKDAVMRRIWDEIVKAPRWEVVQSDKPDDAPAELWSMVPKVIRP
jgi:hypothetical protein